MVNFITKNAFISTIVILLLLGTLGVSAAEVFAPKDNQPSSLFNTSKFSSSFSSSNSIINSSTQSSLTSTNSSQSSSVSNVSSPSSQTGSSAINQAKLKTYTNLHSPDFKLVYPEDWNFETNTEPSNYPELLTRKYIFRKNDYSFSIWTSPFTGGGCSGALSDNAEVLFANSMKKFINKVNLNIPSETNLVYYGKDSYRCAYSLRLISNIENNNIKNYPVAADDANKSFVSYTTIINTGDFKKDNILIPEIDQIISQSSFK